MRLSTLRLGWGVLLALVLPACGRNSHSTAPAIGDLRLSKSWVYLNSEGGSTTVLGWLSFWDPDGDLSLLNVTVEDLAGTPVSSTSTPISISEGMLSGTLMASAQFSTMTAGFYTVRVTVTDSHDLTSNELTAPFRITPNPWVSKAPMPTPRTYCAVVESGGRIYTIGGNDANVPPYAAMSVVEIYDPATDTWTTGVPLPSAAARLRATSVNGVLHVIGESTHSVFDPALGLWSSREPVPGSAYYEGQAVVTLDGLVYVIGRNRSYPFNDSPVLVYDPGTDSWTARAPYAFSQWSPLATTALEKIWVLLLFDNKPVYAYDPLTDSWSPASDPSTTRGFLGWTGYGGLIFAIGGMYGGRSFDLVEALDPSTGKWMPKAPLPKATPLNGTAVVNGKIYAISWGGGPTFEYTPGNDPY